jgi:mannose-6-phosphate isomerase-like protein (cupin superfamily)
MNTTSIKTIRARDQLVVIIIYSDYRADDIQFFTPDNFSQQLAYMNRKAGYTITPHVHNEVKREVVNTQEVLLIRKGKVRVDLYGDDRKYIESVILSTGDVILFASGGHGFEMLEDTEIIEVKQGPYVGERDKTRFDAVQRNRINIVHD